MNKINDPKIMHNLGASIIILGENSFLPSGLLQWAIFAILVFIIVILIRKVFGLSNKYFSTPLKHD